MIYSRIMTTVEDIEKAIATLSMRSRTELMFQVVIVSRIRSSDIDGQ